MRYSILPLIVECTYLAIKCASDSANGTDEVRVATLVDHPALSHGNLAAISPQPYAFIPGPPTGMGD